MTDNALVDALADTVGKNQAEKLGNTLIKLKA